VLKKIIALNVRCASWLEKRLPALFGPENFDELTDRISRDIAARSPVSILEIGGIDRPLLPRSPRYRYIGLDIEERPDCYRVYDEFLVQSIEKPVSVAVDMIVSRTLLEHVRDNQASARSMFGALNAGGVMHHYVPSKWHPYSIVLRVVGHDLQRRILSLLRPDAMSVAGYAAFFDYCSPGDMSALFERQGFKNISVRPSYNGKDYFVSFLPAFVLVSLFEAFCRVLNLRFFCSGFVISAGRAADAR